MDGDDRLTGEQQMRDTARNPNALGDVGGGFVERKRHQLASKRHPLLELPQAGIVQARRQLGLADERDRERFSSRRFRVGQQPDLLEQFVRQALSLVRGYIGHNAALLAVPIGKHHSTETVEDPALKRMAEVVFVAGLCADVFVDENPAKAIAAMRKICADRFQLSEADCDAIMEAAGQQFGAMPLITPQCVDFSLMP